MLHGKGALLPEFKITTGELLKMMLWPMGASRPLSNHYPVLPLPLVPPPPTPTPSHTYEDECIHMNLLYDLGKVISALGTSVLFPEK